MLAVETSRRLAVDVQDGRLWRSLQRTVELRGTTAVVSLDLQLTLCRHAFHLMHDPAEAFSSQRSLVVAVILPLPPSRMDFADVGATLLQPRP
jgi:hypothetical protein